LTMVLVLGATGMTGRTLVEQLLGKNHKVRVVVRSPHKFSREIRNNPDMTVVEAGILDLTDEQMAEQVKDCDAVVSCLGHVLDFKGMFGDPRKLCTDVTRRLCDAIEVNSPSKPTKFILMSTVGVSNPECEEKRTWFERGLLTLLRHALPPHSDNETAAEHLSRYVGKRNSHVAWCAVRPDSLINAQISPYEIMESPSTGILSGRPTSRSNVAHFMVELIGNPELWRRWRFRMPVVMNAQSVAGTSG